MKYIFFVLLCANLFLQCKNETFEILYSEIYLAYGEMPQTTFVVVTSCKNNNKLIKFAKELQEKDKSFYTEILFFNDRSKARKFNIRKKGINKNYKYLTAKYFYNTKGEYEEFCYGNKDLFINKFRNFDGWQKCNNVSSINFFDKLNF